LERLNFQKLIDSTANEENDGGDDKECLPKKKLINFQHKKTKFWLKDFHDLARIINFLLSGVMESPSDWD
jgi:hypothetical protein